jgi:hypothetical protein
MRFAENKHLISFSFFCLVVFGLFSYNFAKANDDICTSPANPGEVCFAWNYFVTSYECTTISFKQGVWPNEINGAFFADTTTANKVCQLKGYSRSTRTLNYSWASSWDNFCVRWDAGSLSWKQEACSWYIQDLYCANDTCPSNAFKRCVGDYIYWFNFCGVQESQVPPTCFPNGCQTGPQNGICGTQCAVVAPAVYLEINGSDSPGPIDKNTSATLSWMSIHNPASCTATGGYSGWPGPKAFSGSDVSTGNLPSGTYTYTITCTNTAGSGSDSVTLTVLPDLPTVNLEVASSSGGTYFDGPLDNLPYNTPAFLKWSATDAVSCTASGGSTGWPGSKLVSGSDVSTGDLSSGTYTYTITCTNTAGTSLPDSVTVNVNQKPTVTVNPPIPNPCVKSSFGSDAGKISISWTYNDIDDNSQSDSQVRVSTDSTFSGGVQVCPFLASSNTSQFITKITPESGCPAQIRYGQTYYWSVRVRDGIDWSDWVNGRDLNQDPAPPEIPGGPEYPYVPVRPYPYAGFTHTSSVKINQVAHFEDTSRCYNGTDMSLLCSNVFFEGSVSYSWDFDEENVQKCELGQLQYCSTSIIKGDATHIYSTISPLSSPYPAVLTINDGKSCSKTAFISVGIAFKPPVWFETASF